VKLDIEIAPGLDDVEAEQWDAMAGDDDPFAEYAFLHALEQSGSVGESSGWQPVHVLARDGERLVGALPLYAKSHSYGEYIFDWSWAGAAERAGVSYYPKLVSMAPLTPATGRRILRAPDVDPAEITQALLAGVSHVAQEIKASSVHLLFLTEEECGWVTAGGQLQPRLSSQFHWQNDGYADFDDFLGRFRSSQRKQVRRERRSAAASGVEVRVVEGADLTDDDVAALSNFYFDTCYKRGSGPYLTRRFFMELKQTLAHRVVAVLGYRDGKAIAGTLNFEKGKHLYGRYWGCTEEVEFLHFECCYYRLIERAIERKLQRFEAGAQGRHKLRRGLMPSPIHSAHFVAHPGLADAVYDYLPREAMEVRDDIARMAMQGPFRRD